LDSKEDTELLDWRLIRYEHLTRERSIENDLLRLDRMELMRAFGGHPTYKCLLSHNALGIIFLVNAKPVLPAPTDGSPLEHARAISCSFDSSTHPAECRHVVVHSTRLPCGIGLDGMELYQKSQVQVDSSQHLRWNYPCSTSSHHPSVYQCLILTSYNTLPQSPY
jgi:hypothetical protein